MARKAKMILAMIPAEETRMSPLRMVIDVFEIHGDGFGPAEPEDEKHQGSDEVQVAQGIQGQPAHPLCRRVAHLIGNPTMGQFVYDDGIKQRYSQEEKRERVLDEKVQ